MVVVVLLICLLISSFFFFNDTATTEIYTLSLHDALPISCEAAGRDRLDGVGHHLRSRPGATGDRRVGGHLVLPRRARRHAPRRLADRTAREGGPRPGGPGERVSRHPAPRGSRRTLPGGAGAEQPGHPALLPGGAPLRADVGGGAALDVAGAGAPGARPGRGVRQLHLRLRAGPGNGAAAAARLPALPLRRPAQPVPGERGRRHASTPAAAGRAGVVRLLRRGAAEC